jgi:hypothetical protein
MGQDIEGDAFVFRGGEPGRAGGARCIVNVQDAGQVGQLLLGFDHAALVDELVDGCEEDPLGLGQGKQPLRGLEIGGERLLHQDRGAGLDGLLGDADVGLRGRADVDDVEVVIEERVGERAEDLAGGEVRGERAGLRFIDVDDCRERIAKVRQLPRMPTAHEAGPDHGGTQVRGAGTHVGASPILAPRRARTSSESSTMRRPVEAEW